MSRIGKQPIIIPKEAAVKVENGKISVKGPKGELSYKIRPEIKAEIKDGSIVISPISKMKKTSAFWGLTRALINNMVKGVTQGYEKRLEIEGIGFKALLDGKDLVLSLGFTHPVAVKVPEGVQFKVEKNVIVISGFDKDLVGRTAARIRSLKKPEPYKGKGIRYQGEVVRRKAGKKAVAAGG